MELTEFGGCRRLRLPERLAEGDLGRLRGEIAGASEGEIVVLEGSGDVFCLGGALPPEEAGGADAPARFGALLAAIEASSRPVVALVNGDALGGGVGLAAAADLVLASPRARFGLPETLLGLVPAVVFPVLARRVGPARARLLALGHPPLPAATALGWGLVDEVADDLDAALRRHCRRFLRMGPEALATLKSLVARHYGAPPGYAAEAASRLGDLLGGEEARVRINQYLGGRAPWPDREED
jgi:polyketide biosynthesis enoyl-CoA hydratase PksH